MGGEAAARLIEPELGIRVADEPEEPAEEGETVAAAQSEARGVGRECLGEAAGVVVDVADRVSDDVGDGFGVFVVQEEVGGDAGWARDRQATQFDPWSWSAGTDMKADIETAGLMTGGDGELVAVGGEVADAVHLSCGAVGDDALLQRTLPARDGRGEPQPRCAQLHVVWDRGACEAVHTMTHAFEQRIGHEAFDRRPRDSRGELSLLTGEETHWSSVMLDRRATADGRDICCSLYLIYQVFRSGLGSNVLLNTSNTKYIAVVSWVVMA